jgi:magnesium transporter
MPMTDKQDIQDSFVDIKNLMERHKLLESLQHKQNLAELRRILEQLQPQEMARMLETLSDDELPLIWKLVSEHKKEEVLLEIADEIRVELVNEVKHAERSLMSRVFDLHEGLLREIPIETRDDLAKANPVWIDLVMPDIKHLEWAKEVFDVDLPNPRDLNDLESSARFYVEENGEVHLHSDFLLDRDDDSRNVAVAFILFKETLFSIRSEELPVFHLQRLRARSESGYVTDAKDVLLDLYSADVEYSANALEDVYMELETVGKQVYSSEMTDRELHKFLTAIAGEEDLNGRIRRNLLDTRRALSFLLRAKFLSSAQHENVREILRDIESLDGHTAFLFNKINFLMDALVGFVNINQNKTMKQLTVISVVFMPLNVIAGMGGMSEFSAMTEGIPLSMSYGILTLALIVIGMLTYNGLRYFENRRIRISSARSRV